MAEQFLHDAHVGATFHEVRRERMPEGVRGNPGSQTSPVSRGPQHCPGRLARKRSAAGVEEQGWATPAARGKRWPHPHEVGLNGPSGERSHWHSTLFFFFSGGYH